VGQNNWNPRQPNIRVRMKNNPRNQGLTTGHVVDSAIKRICCHVLFLFRDTSRLLFLWRVWSEFAV